MAKLDLALILRTHCTRRLQPPQRQRQREHGTSQPRWTPFKWDGVPLGRVRQHRLGTVPAPLPDRPAEPTSLGFRRRRNIWPRPAEPVPAPGPRLLPKMI